MNISSDTSHTPDNGPFSKLLGEKHVLELRTACKVLSMKSGMEKCKLCYLEFPSRKDVAQHIATAHKVEVTSLEVSSDILKILFRVFVCVCLCLAVPFS